MSDGEFDMKNDPKIFDELKKQNDETFKAYMGIQ